MSSIGGQRSRIARANFSPSIEPGMSMSVKTMRMSFRASKMAMASSALDTSIALYPAASTKSAACIRLKNSSSTTRTYGCDAEIKILPWDLKSDASRNNEANLQNPDEGRTFQVQQALQGVPLGTSPEMGWRPALVSQLPGRKCRSDSPFRRSKNE
jgi:hypothetical protein